MYHHRTFHTVSCHATQSWLPLFEISMHLRADLLRPALREKNLKPRCLDFAAEETPFTGDRIRPRRSFGAAHAAFSHLAAGGLGHRAHRQVPLVGPFIAGGGHRPYARHLALVRSRSRSCSIQSLRPPPPSSSGRQTTSVRRRSAASRAGPGPILFLFTTRNPAISVTPSLYKSAVQLGARFRAGCARVSSGGGAACVCYGGDPICAGARTLSAELVALGRSRRSRETFVRVSVNGECPTYLGIRMLEDASGAKFLPRGLFKRASST